jgi:hypothetical protein
MKKEERKGRRKNGMREYSKAGTLEQWNMGRLGFRCFSSFPIIPTVHYSKSALNKYRFCYQRFGGG